MRYVLAVSNILVQSSEQASFPNRVHNRPTAVVSSVLCAANLGRTFVRRQPPDGYPRAAQAMADKQHGAWSSEMLPTSSHPKGDYPNLEINGATLTPHRHNTPGGQRAYLSHIQAGIQAGSKSGHGQGAESGYPVPSVSRHKSCQVQLGCVYKHPGDERKHNWSPLHPARPRASSDSPGIPFLAFFYAPALA